MPRPILADTARGVLAAGVACLAYGTFVEPRAFRVRRVGAAVLPPGSATLRVLHLSDTHLLPWHTARRHFLSSLAGLEPDLVISTGDHISSADAVGPLVAALGRLLRAPGAFVFGSNDYVSPRVKNPAAYLWSSTGKLEPAQGDLPTDALRAALTSGGWLDLNQRRGHLTVRGVRVALRGTDDAHEHRDDYTAVAGPAADGVLALGVTHAPYRRVLDAMTADGVGLILAGHTHGGQVCVPGHGALISNCDLPPRLAKGLFRHEAHGKSAWVNVSAGVGMSPFAPFRFACPPEITLLTLTARTK